MRLRPASLGKISPIFKVYRLPKWKPLNQSSFYYKETSDIVRRGKQAL